MQPLVLQAKFEVATKAVLRLVLRRPGVQLLPVTGVPLARTAQTAADGQGLGQADAVLLHQALKAQKDVWRGHDFSLGRPIFR